MRIERKQAFQVVAMFAACGIVVACARPSLAQKPFLERIKKVYSLEKEKNGNCHTCHTYDKEKKETPEKDNLNAFGKDIQKSPIMKTVINKDDDYKFTKDDLDKVEAAVKSLEDKDSDGDGATNLEELMLGTSPGNPTSTPTADALAKYRADHPKK